MSDQSSFGPQDTTPSEGTVDTNTGQDPVSTRRSALDNPYVATDDMRQVNRLVQSALSKASRDLVACARSEDALTSYHLESARILQRLSKILPDTIEANKLAHFNRGSQAQGCQAESLSEAKFMSDIWASQAINEYTRSNRDILGQLRSENSGKSLTPILLEKGGRLSGNGFEVLGVATMDAVVHEDSDGISEEAKTTMTQVKEVMQKRQEYLDSPEATSMPRVVFMTTGGLSTVASLFSAPGIMGSFLGSTRPPPEGTDHPAIDHGRVFNMRPAQSSDSQTNAGSTAAARSTVSVPPTEPDQEPVSVSQPQGEQGSEDSQE